MEFSHKPVLLDECISGLNIRPDGIYIDGTAGGGGHSLAIAEKLTSGRLIAMDRDPEAICAAKKRLSKFSDRVLFLNRKFSEMGEAVRELGISGVNGILLDIGVSSYQIDNPERGFSYMADAPLDMRMDQNCGLTAADIVNGYPSGEIEKILYEYGEERWAKRIAAFIVDKRENGRINTTFELNEIIRKAVPAGARADGSHPSKRTFQALRIAVNNEMGELNSALECGTEILAPGGRFCVITFHSLEDRAVKRFFAEKAKGCVCPPQFPVCVCNQKPTLIQVTRKPLEATAEELENNPRSHSAKLRIAEKI